MSLFKKLLGGAGEAEAAPSPAAAAPSPSGEAFPLRGRGLDQLAAQWRAGKLKRRGEEFACEGIDWNAAEQSRWRNEAFPRHMPGLEALATHADGPRGYAMDNPSLTRGDAACLWTAVSELQPTRLMEVGCGWSTRLIRAAINAANLPCELIAIDPAPAVEIDEVVDAWLDQPVQEIPLADFDMLRGGEMLVLDTTHTAFPGGEVLHLYQRVLPRLNPGVVVGVHGVRLPEEYHEDERAQGFAEQALLQAFLTRNAGVEILFASGYLGPDLGAITGDDEGSWLWFRVK